ncbi:MAG: hypothetical protein VX938_11075 [Myxococcota bacterium]|nr:hypothetical protein [Myxococcota bacterium]MEE2779184.1 hypothetical protein [Myxococcota bacterium]
MKDVTSLATEARVSMYGPQGARKGRMVLLAARPASLHASILSPTDDLMGVTTSDGDRFTSFERGAPVCYQGGSCPQNISRLLPVPLEGPDLVNVLLGAPPGISAVSPEARWDRRVGAYRIDGLLKGEDASGSPRNVNIWVSHGDWVLKRMTFDGPPPLPAGSRVEVTWEDPQRVSGHLLPHRVRMKVKEADLDVQIRYRDVGLNDPLGEDAFRVACPPGTRIEEVPCPDENSGPTSEEPEGDS